MSNPDTSFNKSSNEDIDKEVRNLIRKNAGKNKNNSSILDELREKYGKDKNIINAIVDKFNKKMNRVKKLSQKIKERLLAKYPNLSVREYINKINEYKTKYEFDDSEAHAIINDIFMNKTREHYDPNDVYSMSNEMTKALGFVPASYNLSGSLNIDKDQVESLQKIIQLDELYGDLHNQVILQSTIYEGVEKSMVDVGIERNKINIYSFVHPVVAALFLPKFKLIDEHMLIASISRIINQKYRGIELQTQPEYELYWDIATDPAETACVTKSKPFDDLEKRCIVQIKLMESVLSLRQGKFFMNDLSSFILAIDNCRASVFDAADLAYVKDEGTILRKLLAAFSLRPTIVLTRPVYNIASAYSNIPALAAGHITSLPMITIRLPNTEGGLTFRSVSGEPEEPESIEKALTNQRQLYIHHRQIVEKQQEVLYSRGLLIFYIHRRYFKLDSTRLAAPYAMAKLPVTMASQEQLNDKALSISNPLNLGKEVYNLKSFVNVQTKELPDPKDLTKKIDGPIICCTAHVVLTDKESTGLGKSSGGSVEYKPLDMGDDDKVKALTWVTASDSISKSQKKGTIFIYELETEESRKAVKAGTPSTATGTAPASTPTIPTLSLAAPASTLSLAAPASTP